MTPSTWPPPTWARHQHLTNVAGTDNTGAGRAKIDSTIDSSGLKTVIDNIDGAIDFVNTQRATMGAAQNRFDAVISNLQVSVENQNAARSRITDADFATETANLSRAPDPATGRQCHDRPGQPTASAVLRLLRKPTRIRPTSAGLPTKSLAREVRARSDLRAVSGLYCILDFKHAAENPSNRFHQKRTCGPAQVGVVANAV